MADTTTTQAVQPIQQDQVSLQEYIRTLEGVAKEAEAERNKQVITGIDPNRQPVTLKGIEIIQQIDKFGDTPGEYSDSSPIQGEYYRFKFQGAIFTASPEFKDAFDAKELYSVRFTPTLFPRNVADPNNAGATKQVQGYGWSMDKATTLDDMAKARVNMQRSRDIEFGIMKDEALTEKKLELFKATDLSKLITEDDMKAMMGAI